MRILCVSPQKPKPTELYLLNSKLFLERFYRTLPDAHIVYSFAEALRAMEAHQPRYDYVITTYTLDCFLTYERDDSKLFPDNYTEALAFLKQVFAANPLVRVVVYSGARKQVADETLSSVGHSRIAWVEKKHEDDSEVQEVLSKLQLLSGSP